MLQRLYVHNFCCLQNFEIKPGDNSSLLLIGKNGVGKSTVGAALALLQQLGAGTSSVESLVSQGDLTLGRTRERISFEVEVLLDSGVYIYSLVLDLPNNFRKLRVVEEKCSVNGELVFSRQEAQVTYFTKPTATEFNLDWHSVALPLIGERKNGPLQLLRNWLRGMHILAPVPQLVKGESRSQHDPLSPLSYHCENFADYLSNLLGTSPASYIIVFDFLKKLLPDLKEFNNTPVAAEARMLEVVFGDNDTTFKLGFDRLSDGEKYMFICAAVLAALERHGNLFVFWDEPDNYLAMTEIEHFIRRLRKSFRHSSQIWMTSHNEETINCFSHENTFLLRRKNHWDPVELRPLSELIGDKESVARKLRLDELD